MNDDKISFFFRVFTTETESLNFYDYFIMYVKCKPI